jgi:hypothetical protein
MMQRFPNITDEKGKGENNAAIQLFGRRFYKDQTPVEYLAEFLLVFASAKSSEGGYRYQFRAVDSQTELKYWPEDRLPLKFFSFFASSKLETRYRVHSAAYRGAIEALKGKITASEQKRDLSVRLLQSLFSGFVGVAKNRTWATQTFLPASECLLAREVDWRHTKAVGKNPNPANWDETMPYFDTAAHNFMARGGELIYLQLLNVFSRFSFGVDRLHQKPCQLPAFRRRFSVAREDRIVPTEDAGEGGKPHRRVGILRRRVLEGVPLQ